MIYLFEKWSIHDFIFSLSSRQHVLFRGEKKRDNIHFVRPQIFQFVKWLVDRCEHFYPSKEGRRVSNDIQNQVDTKAKTESDRKPRSTAQGQLDNPRSSQRRSERYIKSHHSSQPPPNPHSKHAKKETPKYSPTSKLCLAILRLASLPAKFPYIPSGL